MLSGDKKVVYGLLSTFKVTLMSAFQILSKKRNIDFDIATKIIWSYQREVVHW